MKKIIFSSLVVVSLCLILVGCDKKEKNELVGSWKNDTTVEGYEFIYTFNEDGTGNYNAAGNVMNFTYKTDGNKISFDYTDEGMVTFDTTYSIDGNKLNVKDSNNDDTIYIKQKK